MTDPAMTPERAEEWARRFHETYERLAPAHGYETREASAKPWEEVPERNRALMVATVGAVLHDLLAHIKVLTDELAAKTEVAKSNKRVVESYAEQVERVTRERDEARARAEQLREQRDDMLAIRDNVTEQVGIALVTAREQLAWLGGQVTMVRGLAEGVIRMSEPGFEDQASVRAGEIVRIFATKPDGNTPIESPAAPSVDGEHAPTQPTTSTEAANGDR